MSRFIAGTARLLPVPRSRWPLWDELVFRFYKWASREIDPMHPDVGLVCITRNELRHARRGAK